MLRQKDDMTYKKMTWQDAMSALPLDNQQAIINNKEQQLIKKQF